MEGLSKSQIDRLGERLRKGGLTESDLRLLDEHRLSFGDAYQRVVSTLREQRLSPTGRSAKSTTSIVDKLRRESIRLSQMQDIAGCRVVVGNVVEQDAVVASLSALLSGASVIDRRANPSYGYRAVHIIAEVSDRPVEIQLRSPLQHLWAELSEKASDVVDPALKYGGGPTDWRELLVASSGLVATYERLENEVDALYLDIEVSKEPRQEVPHTLDARKVAQILQETRRVRESKWKETTHILNVIIALLDVLERRKQ